MKQVVEVLLLLCQREAVVTRYLLVLSYLFLLPMQNCDQCRVLGDRF